MKKTILFILLLTIILKPSTSFAHKQNSLGQTFPDVSHINANYDLIDYLTYIGVVKGNLQGNFNPSQSVTNKQVALMLVRALGEEEREFFTPPNYKDVSIYTNGYKEIAIATELGIFPKEPYFYPNRPITRDEMARAITRAFNLKLNKSHIFKDVPNNYWAHDYISTIAHYNITTGYEDKTFRPKQHLTRSHFAAFVARALLPEIRPTNNVIYYSKDMMPNVKINQQNFLLAQHSTVMKVDKFNFIRNESLDYQGILTANSAEGTKKMYENTPSHFTIYNPNHIQIPYPIYSGKQWSIDSSIPGLTITYTIATTQDVAVLPHAIYTGVIKINAKYSTIYGDYAPETFWFAPGYGFIRSMIGDGYNFLEETKQY